VQTNSKAKCRNRKTPTPFADGVFQLAKFHTQQLPDTVKFKGK